MQNLDPTDPVTDIAFSTTLPAGVVVASPVQAITDCSNGAVSAADGGSTISFAGGSLGTGVSCGVDVVVRLSTTAGSYQLPAVSLTSSGGASVSATANVNVVTTLPGLTKSFTDASINLNDVTTLTYTFDNSQNANFGNPIIAETLPAGLVVAPVANTTSNCTGAAFTTSPGSGSVGLNVVLLAGATCTASVDVQGVVPGTWAAFSSYTSGGTAAGSASAALTVVKALVQLSFVDDAVVPGDSTVLQITLTNLRRDDATAIRVSLNLGAALSGLVATGLPLTNVCGVGSQLTGTGVVTLTGGALPAAASCVVQVPVTVPLAAALGTYAVSTDGNASATLNGTSENWGTATTDLIVGGRVELELTLTPNPVAPGSSVTLEYTLTNTDTVSAATSVSFVHWVGDLEASPPSSTLPSGGFCGASAAVARTSTLEPPGFRMTGMELAPSASCTFQVTMPLSSSFGAGIHHTFTTAVGALINGNGIQSPGVIADLAVAGAPAISKTFIPNPALPGETVMLEYTLAFPTGLGTATDVAFTDDLEAALSGLTATGLPMSDVCGPGSSLTGTGLITLTGGTIGEDQDCVFSVPVTIPLATPNGAYPSTTSAVTATVSGLSTSRAGTTSTLNVTSFNLTKRFVPNQAFAGDSVQLEFTLENSDPAVPITSLNLNDALGDLAGLVTMPGLPQPACNGTVAATSGLTLTGASLAASETCTFSVDLQLSTLLGAGDYSLGPSNVTATTAGGSIVLGLGTATLTLLEPLSWQKAFAATSVLTGGTESLEFSISNVHHTFAATTVRLSEELGSPLAGLLATGLPMSDVCGAGSVLSGTDVITLTGGQIAAGGTCTFSVDLAFPTVGGGTAVHNVTSQLTGTVGPLNVTMAPVTADINVASFDFAKSFSGSPVLAGTVTMSFTLTNNGPMTTDLAFTDNLFVFRPGLTPLGLPKTDVCGSGSTLSGDSARIALSNGVLRDNESCTFDLDLMIGAGGVGDFVNSTSSLTAAGVVVAAPATATMTVVPSTPIQFDFQKIFGGPVLAGTVASLEFYIGSLSIDTATQLSFSDDLDAVLPGLVASFGTGTNVCGNGSLLTGTSSLSLTGGRVDPGGNCTFEVLLDVPADAVPGVYQNETSELRSTGLATGSVAFDDLVVVEVPLFDKHFTPAMMLQGGVSTLTFTVDAMQNPVITPGLGFIDTLPADVFVAATPNATTDCVGGVLTAAPGSSTITLSGASVGANDACTVAVDVTSSVLGAHVNTSEALVCDFGMGDVATATLTVAEVVTDVDGDGVDDVDDVAPNDPNACRDVDGDGCDDCSVTGDDASGGDPSNDGTDLDGDGTCDASDPPGDAGGGGDDDVSDDDTADDDTADDDTADDDTADDDTADDDTADDDTADDDTTDDDTTDDDTADDDTADDDTADDDTADDDTADDDTADDDTADDDTADDETPTDAAADDETSPDAGAVPGGGGDDGCGCRVVGTTQTRGLPAATWLLLALGLVLLRRRPGAA